MLVFSPGCRAVKEEDGMGPAKGSNSLSGRELRALMRSHQEKDVGLQDNKPGSTKGERPTRSGHVHHGLDIPGMTHSEQARSSYATEQFTGWRAP